MALDDIRNIKEIDDFKPFLKIGSAVKDQQDAFAFTMVRKKSTNIAIRRSYSSKSDHFLVVHIFFGKKRNLVLSNWEPQKIQYTNTNNKKSPVLF